MLELQAVERLKRDLRNAELTQPQARYVVDAYYQMQDFRIQAAGQLRSAESEEPIALVRYLLDQFQVLEGEVQKVLGRWAAQSEVGNWSLSITGIGPVIAAGLLAHIDIQQAPTVGHIWRFGGLDPSMQWQGTKAARELVAAALEVEKTPAATVDWLARATHRRTSDLWRVMGVEIPSRDSAITAVTHVAGCETSEVSDLFAEREHHVDNAIGHSCEQLGIDSRDVYELLYPADQHQLDAQKLRQFLARRPWNAKLKTLLWKVGDSFVKQSNRPSDVYGKVYRARKELELERDAKGLFADTAAATLASRKIEDKATRELYEDGRLPLGRLELRARRVAVKLFLAHWHHVAYESHYGKPPPKPYILTHDADHHTEFLAPPNWPMAE